MSSREADAATAAAPPLPDAAGDISAAAQKVAADIGRALAEGRANALSAAAIQALMAAACLSYSARVEAMGEFPPLAARSRVTSTDVMITASGLLKAANLAVFELGMWQSWTGR
jgi:enoyl-[acyl-carrier-protein] reductase (NADH)